MGTTPAARLRLEGQARVLSPDLVLALHFTLYSSFYLLGPSFPNTQGTVLQWVSCSLIFETLLEIP